MHESNPQWAKDRAAGAVFEASRMVSHKEFRDKMEEFGADSEVLAWMDQGGCKVCLSKEKVRELGKEGLQPLGLNKRNGGRAREHGEDLRTVVMEVLLKGSYEVVTEEGVDNVIPMNLAPKPGKDPPRIPPGGSFRTRWR